MPFDPPSTPPPSAGDPYEFNGRNYEFDGTIWRSTSNGLENFYWVIALSDKDTPLTTGDKDSVFIERAFVITKLPRITVDTNPTGSAVIADIRKNTSSIFASGSEPQIDAGTWRSAASVDPPVLASNPTSFSAGDAMIFSVLQVGATFQGDGLKAHIFGRWTE